MILLLERLPVFLSFEDYYSALVGKIGTGILWLFTAGCFGIGNLIDFINFMKGTLTDKNGQMLVPDCPKVLKTIALVLFILGIVGIVLSFLFAGGAIIAAIAGSM